MTRAAGRKLVRRWLVLAAVAAKVAAAAFDLEHHTTLASAARVGGALASGSAMAMRRI